MLPRRLSKKNPVKARAEHVPDKSLIITIFILVVFGLIMLFSASAVAGYLKAGSTLHFLNRQLAGLGLGLVAFFVCAKIDYHWWRHYAFHFLLFSILLLLLVFVPGLRATYGTANNWINIFGISLQPSEFVKISFLLYLAAWLEARRGDFNDWQNSLLPFIGVFGIIAVLMLLQPDLGTLVIIFGMSLGVYYVGGGKLKHILGLLAVLAIGAFLFFNLRAYQMDRLKCYQNPESNSDTKCYQINQSLIAIGSGGFWGRGLGQSRQKFGYLPEVWSDSIFAAVAEELGFIFSTVLIGLFLFLFFRGQNIAARAPDEYGRILAMGIVILVMIQLFINVGGIINLIPMTGVPLPFFSSGGSALAAMLGAMGILVNISKQTK
jgi:cell division protein FtsW